MCQVVYGSESRPVVEMIVKKPRLDLNVAVQRDHTLTHSPLSPHRDGWADAAFAQQRSA